MKKTLRLTAIIMAIVMTVLSLNLTAFAASTLARPVVTATVTSTTNPTIKLTWAKVAGATKYYVYRRDTASGSLSLYKKTSNLYLKDTEVIKSKTYYYKVKAVTIKNSKVTNSSATSKTVNATVSALVAPKVTAKALSASQIKISWAKVAGATRYYMYRSTDGKTYNSIGYTTQLNYTFKNLNMSTKYYFKVKSANVVSGKVKKSSYSQVVNAKTQAQKGWHMNEFVKIPNGKELPTGSAITCLAMLMNYYGADVDKMDLYEEFYCFDKFTKESNGNLIGKDPGVYFVGDPTSKKQYYLGAISVCIITTFNRFVKKYDISNVKRDLSLLFSMGEEKYANKIKAWLDDGNIGMVSFFTVSNPKIFDYYYYEDDGDRWGFNMYEGTYWTIICGYTDDGYWITYNPQTDKYEKIEIKQNFQYQYTSFTLKSAS